MKSVGSSACSSAVHAGRDGGLRDPQPFGGAVEAAGLDKVEEGVEKFDLHGGPLPVAGPGGFTPRTPVDIWDRRMPLIGFADQ